MSVHLSSCVDLATIIQCTVLTLLQISISACQDGEQTWDTTKGVTFTQVRTAVDAGRPSTCTQC